MKQSLPALQETTTLSGTELLAAIDVERAAAHAVIDGLPDRRRALLENDAPDSDFDAFNRAQAKAERDLARLDLRERGAVQRARIEHEASLTTAWREQRSRFQAKAVEVVECLRDAIRKHDELQALMPGVYAAANGNEAHIPVLLNPLMVSRTVDTFEEATRNIPDTVLVPPIEANLHAVEFVRVHGNFNIAEQAIYPAAQAWPLVDSGTAVWAPGTKAPRRPVKHVHRPLPAPTKHVVLLGESNFGRSGDVVRLLPREATMAIRDGAARRAELAEVKS